MDEIQKLVIERIPTFSKNQKKLANFVLENLQTITLLSVNDMAKMAGVSSATVVRFARALGYKGYLEFRNELSARLKEQLSPVEKYRATISHKDDFKNSLEKIAGQVVSNINKTLQINTPIEFSHIVEHLKEAENIFCIGMGVSHYMAEIMAYLLKLYMKKAFALSGDSPSYQEQVILLSPGDLLIFYSFPPYSRQTVEAAQFANELNIPIISFTDKRTAPIVPFSTHALIAKTDNVLFTNSLGAISVMMNALVTEMALTEEQKVMDGLQKIDAFLKDSRYFY